MLIFTSGLPARGLLRWIASAISSLPVPLSPRIRTGARVFATRPSVDSTFSNSGCCPTIPRRSSCASSAWRSSRPAVAGTASSSVVLTSSTSCVLCQGLVKKSAAPTFTPFTARAIEPQAVISNTGRPGCCSLIRASRASPSSPLVCGEKFMSCNTRSIDWASRMTSARAGSSQVSTSKPDWRSSRASDTSTEASSSTTSTRCLRGTSVIIRSATPRWGSSGWPAMQDRERRARIPATSPSSTAVPRQGTAANSGFPRTHR